MNNCRFTVKIVVFKFIAYAGFVFLFITSIAFLATKYVHVLILIYLILLPINLYLLLTTGSIIIDNNSIIHQTKIGCHQIRWDEVLVVEFDEQRGSIVFIGNSKQLALPGLMYWSGTEGKSMMKFVEDEICRRAILTEVTQKALFKISKNTKVKNK